MNDRSLPAPRLSRWRPRLLLGVLGAGMLGIACQSWQVQVGKGSFLRNQGELRYQRQLPVPTPARASIYDRNGQVLAVSVPTTTLWVEPAIFTKHRDQWPRLEGVLGMDARRIDERIAHGGSAFAYLDRQLDPGTAERAMALRVPGLHPVQEYRRFYPMGEVTGPLLGFTNVDGKGSEGMELAYDHALRSWAGRQEVLRDNRGQSLQVSTRRPSRLGQDLYLTIDSRLQYVTYRALAAAVQGFAARSGSAVLLDTQTGAILAMVSYPANNPNDRDHYNPGIASNRAITHAFEPGSVMKPFAVAAGLDSGHVQAQQRFAVDTNCFRVGSYCIRDDVRHGTLSIGEILKYSSNIGAAKIALATPAKDLYGLLQKLGFGGNSLGLPGETSGRLPDWHQWSPASHAAMAYGYGISVNTLQLAAAYGAIAHDGVYVPPHLILGQRLAGTRVMSSATAAHLRNWLAGVVAPGGTGFLAAIPGYSVAGKTGTAAMADGKGGFHHHQVNTTFVGFAPVTHPRYVMAVTVRDPTRGWRYGGVVAAPVFRVSMAEALRLGQVAPDRDLSPTGLEKISALQQQRWAEGGGDAVH